MSVPDNPFIVESNGNSQPTSSRSSPPQYPLPHSTLAPPLPNLAVPPPAHHQDGSGSSSAASYSPPRSAPAGNGLNSAPANILQTGSTPPHPKSAGRRVQWPEHLSSHVTIPITSPPSPNTARAQQQQTLQDQGAREALQYALEQHERNYEDRRQPNARFSQSNDPESQPVSEGTTRAPSEASDGDADLADVREEMGVYVDPDERDGMPNAHPEREERDNQRAAAELVRAHTSGRFGFLRQRKTSKVKTGEVKKGGEGVLGAVDMEKKGSDDDGTGMFGKRLKEAGNGLGFGHGNVDEVPSIPPRKPRGLSGAFTGPGGVLSSLMALQNGNSSTVSDSAPPSVLSTPASSRPASRRGSRDGSGSDSEEDELERLKFLRERRIARGMAVGNGWKAPSSAKMTPNWDEKDARRSRGTSIYDTDRDSSYERDSTFGSTRDPTSTSHHQRGASSLSNFLSNRSSASINYQRDPTSPLASPPIGSPGEVGTLSARTEKTSAMKGMQHQMKKLGDRLGLETETSRSRPAMAKSSAGVFGGLIASTGNIAGVASPAATVLAPDARRPGYHLSRYSGSHLDEDDNGNPRSPGRSPGRSPNNRPSSLFSSKSAPPRPSSLFSTAPTVNNDPTLRSSTDSSGNNTKVGLDLHNGSAPMSPPITITDTHTRITSSPGTYATSLPLTSTPTQESLLGSQPISQSFSENAKKRRKNAPSLGLKGIENFAVGAGNLALGAGKMGMNVAYAPVKLAKGAWDGGKTPDRERKGDGDYFGVVKSRDGEGGKKRYDDHKETIEEREKREWEKEKKRRRKIKEKKRQEQIFITMHVAAILQRQDFILKLARAFMMFGAPSHRLEAQMQATARVLEINCQMVYIPGVMLVSFGDPATHTSETKFLKQANGLDLGKLLSAHMLYWNVVHDKMAAPEASAALDILMTSKPTYNLWQNLIIGGLASAFIQPSAFYGSFIDCLVSIPLGMLLVLVQVAVSKNDLYSSLFEIVIATINSFLAAAIASSGQFCFAAVASGSVVLILPGYIVLCGSLELGNRSIISGSVRLVYSVLYSLFLGFGLAMGSEVYIRITGKAVTGSQDYQCTALRANAPWYQATISPWFYFLTAPAYLLCLGMRNGQPLFRKETIVMVIIGSAGFATNYFSGKAFVNRSDITSTLGSFVVGVLGGIYGKFTKGSAFVVMVAGILFQLPSGLSNGGLLRFASESTAGSADSYSSGFQVAEQLIQVAIGLTVGLFVSAALVNVFGGGRRRGANLSSF